MFLRTLNRPTGRKIPVRALSALFLGALLLVQSSFVAAEQLDPAFDLPKGSEVAVARLLELRPDIPIIAVYPISVEGMFGIDLPGGTTLFATQDGKHLFAGELFAMGEELVSLSEQRRSSERVELMAQVASKDMVIFPAKGKTLDYIHIFTDVDCGYCRKLHAEIADYSELGIEVRYLAYPRTGLDGETHKKMSNVWCSADRKRALTKAKLGLEVDADTCVDPVVKQFQLGRMIGVSGTPAIVTSDGRLLPGYVPAPDLLARLQQ
jgi:thiol:disulfide interchange protein DsbC